MGLLLMKMVSRNVRGINDPSKHKLTIKSDWVGLQETKVSAITVPIVSQVVSF